MPGGGNLPLHRAPRVPCLLRCRCSPGPYVAPMLGLWGIVLLSTLRICGAPEVARSVCHIYPHCPKCCHPPLRAGVCPARTGHAEGPNFPTEDRGLPYWAGCPVKIAICGADLRRTRSKSQGAHAKFSPFGGRMRAGQTFPLCLLIPDPGCLVCEDGAVRHFSPLGGERIAFGELSPFAEGARHRFPRAS